LHSRGRFETCPYFLNSKRYGNIEMKGSGCKPEPAGGYIPLVHRVCAVITLIRFLG